MHDSSFNETLSSVKAALYKSTSYERNWWNSAATETKKAIIDESAEILKASEFAYQQDSTAKFNQLISTNYDSLPSSIKNSITESLIASGELPDPSDYVGIGQAFEVNGEVAMECDRCDEVFMSTEDFDTHKNIDHGDTPTEYDDAEESYEFSMNPDINRYALKEARKIITEEDQGVLTRSVYFNGKDMPQPTELEPDDVKGLKGYNDNPNEGLYDNKIFKHGNSQDRQDGSVTEAVANEGITDNSYWEERLNNAKRQNSGYEQIMGQLQELEREDPENASYYKEKYRYIVDAERERPDPMFYESVIVSEADNYPQKKGEDDWDEKLASLKDEYEDKDVVYNEADTLSDVTMVDTPAATDKPIKSIKDIQFNEEAVEFVYPTLKITSTESYSTEDHLLDDYSDGDIDSDEEAVEYQITERKMAGYGDQTIASELVMQYGISMDEALEKAYSIEVSINDRVSNTIFGKRYNECTESEIKELELYSGNDY